MSLAPVLKAGSYGIAKVDLIKYSYSKNDIQETITGPGILKDLEDQF
jgi:hypothetical protein